MGDELTTNKKTLLEENFDELIDRIGFEPKPQYQWMGMQVGDDDDGIWSWMDEDNRTPNEILEDHIRQLQLECNSAHNDGWTALSYKKQIYEMKCMIEDIYNSLNVIDEEEEKKWEKERVFNKLKGTEK
jgi:hypothetical protein